MPVSPPRSIDAVTPSVGTPTIPDRLRGAIVASWFVLPFAALYMAFGATFGLIGSAAPLVFRARGMPLAEVGLLQIMYLPVGLSFLWAPLLDRIKLPFFPLRIGWIVFGQVTTIILVLVLSRGEHWPAFALLFVALATCTATATMDVALEALVVETVSRSRRPQVTTAKLCCIALGGTVGISLATMFPASIGLPQALLIVALLDLVLLLPILAYPEVERRRIVPDTGKRPSTLFRLHAIVGRALAIGCYFATALMMGEASTVVLVDLRLPLPLVGFLTGTLTMVLTIAMTIASGALTMRFASHWLVAVFAGGVTLGGCLTMAATAYVSAWLGIVAAVINIACTAGLGVPIYNMIYRWAEGTGAATDYALLFGCAFMISLPARLGAPALAGALGWPSYFAVSIPLYVAAIILVVVAMKRTARQEGRPA